LDNINKAEAVVIERLNPLLEKDPVWQLTEKDDHETLSVNSSSSFHLFATMTIESYSSLRDREDELSPALYNRLRTALMKDLEENGEATQILEMTNERAIPTGMCRKVGSCVGKLTIDGARSVM
jgi:midasin (ATPase involved in ribosome maturation)